MSNLSRFDFCPKCGALARDGVCQSCGYVNPDSVPKPADRQEQQFQTVMQQPIQERHVQQPAKNNKALIAILIVVVVILGMIFTCCAGGLALYMMDVNFESIADADSERVYPWGEEDEASAEEEEQPSKEISDKKYSEPSKSKEKETSSGDDDEKESEKDAMTRPTQDLEGLENGLYYEAPYNALRDDLVYQITFETGLHNPKEYEDRVTIQVEYPQLTGAAPNLDIINSYLETEYLYYLKYFQEQYEPNITEESVFLIYSQGYVTYMDEKVMSVVFHEEIYIDGQSMIQYYCLNFDMSDGVVLNNVDILNLDLEFAVEFRRREILENGDEWLTDYTDQEILEMLRDTDYLVIFYTPMGMEVGLNLYEVVLYMTYSDYEKFLNLY